MLAAFDKVLETEIEIVIEMKEDCSEGEHREKNWVVCTQGWKAKKKCSDIQRLAELEDRQLLNTNYKNGKTMKTLPYRKDIDYILCSHTHV